MAKYRVDNGPLLGAARTGVWFKAQFLMSMHLFYSNFIGIIKFGRIEKLRISMLQRIFPRHFIFFWRFVKEVWLEFR